MVTGAKIIFSKETSEIKLPKVLIRKKRNINQRPTVINLFELPKRMDFNFDRTKNTNKTVVLIETTSRTIRYSFDIAAIPPQTISLGKMPERIRT